MALAGRLQAWLVPTLVASAAGIGIACATSPLRGCGAALLCGGLQLLAHTVVSLLRPTRDAGTSAARMFDEADDFAANGRWRERAASGVFAIGERERPRSGVANPNAAG